MGTDLAPKVVGLWVGKSWDLDYLFDLPWEDEAFSLQGEEFRSEAGWVGTNRIAKIREGTIILKLGSHTEYEDKARYHIVQNFWKRRPMWIVYDDTKAERAVLAVTPLTNLSFAYNRDWGFRQAEVPWVEHEPKR